jgi:hypothetical protein
LISDGHLHYERAVAAGSTAATGQRPHYRQAHENQHRKAVWLSRTTDVFPSSSISPPAYAQAGSICRPLSGWPFRGPASSRPTDFLPFQSAKNVINGAAYAASIGTPLTIHLTLHWDLFRKYDPGDPIASQGWIINRCTSWLAKHGVPVRYVWVRENGRYKHQHLHWLLHLPMRRWRAFRTFLWKVGGCYRIPGRTDVPFKMEGNKWGMYVPKMWAGCLRYVLKSMCPSARLGSTPIMDALGIDHKRSLPLQGMRSGLSRSIDRTARSNAGWTELNMLPQLRAVLHPCAYH